MIAYQLKIKLLSDTTFGRGDGVAGFVDQEVEHDPNCFPYLRGRTLKGLLSEECDKLIAVSTNNRQYWEQIACNLFGKPGSTDQSPLIVNNSISNTVPTVELRDGVKIDSIALISLL